MASELAFDLTGPTCNLVLGIQQMISLAELSVNRVLDNLDPQQWRKRKSPLNLQRSAGFS